VETGSGLGVSGGAVVVVPVVGGGAVAVVDVVELVGDDVGAPTGGARGPLPRERRVETGDAHRCACGEIATGGFVIWASAITAAAMRT
jgi:hypothetical protein